jgi:hypothetical protein
MARRRHDDRPVYERSGRVAWPRFLPAALLALLVAAGMAYCWFLAFDAGWGYWLATPIVLVLPVALAGYLAVGFGHCRNRFVAGGLGVLVAVVFHAGYFHADLVSQQGPAALTRLDSLPEFIAQRMATDGIKVQNDILPRSELYNWFYSAVELLVISMLVGAAAVYRSQKGYCESCRRWMRSLGFHAKPGASTDIAEALDTGDWSDVPVTVGQMPAIVRASSWLDFEYCPGARGPGSGCAAYLTLKEFTGTTEPAQVLMAQGRLEQDELDALAGRVAALAFLRVSAPTVTGDEGASGRSIERHSGSVAALERLPGHAGGADLDRAGKIEFMLALVPVAALLGGIAMVVWGAVRAPWAGAPPADWLGYILLAAGIAAAVAGGVVCWINVDYLGIRYMYRRICRSLAQRPDALVLADDPTAQFIDVVPRVQWHQLVPDKPADRGLLRLDPAGGRLVFEGLKERYVIPADAVLSCEVEPMLPHTGNWNFFAVVLTVRYPAGAPSSVTGGRRDDEWEIPLLPRSTQFRRYSTTRRRTLATTLQADIEELLDRAARR